MKVAVSASGSSLDSSVDPRFGRSPYHLIVDTSSMAFEPLPNASMGAPSGAGIGAAQAVVQRGVEAVLTGNLGPNATQVLSLAGVKMVTGASGSVRQAVEDFKQGNLKPSPLVGVSGSGFLGGRGMGMGRGRGMGRGMGMGGGRGMYGYPDQSQAPTQFSGQATQDQEKKILAQQLEQLERELREVKKRLEELK